MVFSVVAKKKKKKLSKRFKTFEWSLKVTSRRTYGYSRSKKEIVHGLRTITWSW